MGRWRRRAARALEVTRVARRARVLRVLREVGLVGEREATADGAREFRLALESLGTTFIKLGQLLSSRPDLLPDVYIEELGHLVDEVPPVPFAELEPIVAADLGPDVFVRLDPEPLATASIAQIHPAVLKDGRDVVVKIRRPGVAEQVALDLSLMHSAAGFGERRSETARLLQLAPLADELATHLRAELDFVEEAANAETIARIVAESPGLRVPAVIRPWVTERVLVLERVRGQKLAAGHGLPPERAGALAREFFRAYVRQITVEGVYHADPHRGNVLLTEDGSLALLDFGLLGRLDDDTRRTLVLLLSALAENRADAVADLILSVSLTTLASDEAGFVHEVRRKLPRYHGRSLGGIRAGEALADLQRAAVQHAIRLPTSFALVGKTLSQADSIARTLDPELDPIQLLEEYSLDVVWNEAERRLQPARVAGFAFAQLDPLARLPRKLAQLVGRLESGTVKVGIAPTDLGGLDRVLRSTANRLGAALIVVGLLVSSALMARVDDTVSLVGFLVSAALALYLFWKIVRTPGEL
ncbi:MAG: AarF/ABC1/UbiB kinase family protein [Thermoleophilia bacterium]|nr:AarF/ABC1/UbiB kinase family protein [Thermoleophilia bacterium]